MKGNPYVYPYTLSSAKSSGGGELELCQSSHQLNVECAKAISESIAKNYDYEKSALSKTLAKEMVEEFGHDRVNFVLANTVQRLKNDGRFSDENKSWAKGQFVPLDKVGGTDRRNSFIVTGHSGLIDIVVNQARKEYQSLNLWGITHCNTTDNLDFVGKIMVLHPSMLQGEYKNPRDQLIYCTGGFGCSPNSVGRMVGGKFLSDGEGCQYNRSDFIGELKEEHHPEWLSERLTQMGIPFMSLETKENQLLELILDTFDEQKSEDFNALIEERTTVTTAYKINMAFAVKNEQYNIYRDVDDDVEIGKRYIQEEHSTLDDIIVNNLDFDGIGINLAEDCGRATDIGFVLNYDESPQQIYQSSEIDNLLEEYAPKQQLEQGQSPTM